MKKCDTCGGIHVEPSRHLPEFVIIDDKRYYYTPYRCGKKVCYVENWLEPDKSPVRHRPLSNTEKGGNPQDQQ